MRCRLPIKLAVALLKDRNGVIDLDVPVSGTLDDPKFRLGPIIWKVFVQLLEKAVTAPFALLGSLFGGGPDLQFIDFRREQQDFGCGGRRQGQGHGQSVGRTAAAQARGAHCLAVGDLDRPALVEAQFQTQVRSLAAATGSGKKSAAATPDFESLDPAVQAELLTQLYDQEPGRRTEVSAGKSPASRRNPTLRPPRWSF